MFVTVNPIHVPFICILFSQVREAIELNGKLSTANDHQQCIIDSYKRELDAFQKECINLKV